MERSEQSHSEEYRKNLAEELTSLPKKERSAHLDDAKHGAQYWQERETKHRQQQEEIPTEDGLGVIITKKTLFHGSKTGGIADMRIAEEETVGEGIYFTSEAKNAIGYAQHRARHREAVEPHIYEAVVENLKLCDLRKDENVEKIMQTFRPVLEKWRDEHIGIRREVAVRALQQIDSGNVTAGSVKLATYNLPSEFSRHLQSLGYDGLITYEGGEGDIGNHDTYLIFDPAKAKIIQEHVVK